MTDPNHDDWQEPPHERAAAHNDGQEDDVAAEAQRMLIDREREKNERARHLAAVIENINDRVLSGEAGQHPLRLTALVVPSTFSYLEVYREMEREGSDKKELPPPKYTVYMANLVAEDGPPTSFKLEEVEGELFAALDDHEPTVGEDVRFSEFLTGNGRKLRLHLVVDPRGRPQERPTQDLITLWEEGPAGQEKPVEVIQAWAFQTIMGVPIEQCRGGRYDYTKAKGYGFPSKVKMHG